MTDPWTPHLFSQLSITPFSWKAALATTVSEYASRQLPSSDVHGRGPIFLGIGYCSSILKTDETRYLRYVLIRSCPGPQSFLKQSTVASKECMGKTFPTFIPLKDYVIYDSIPILRHDLCQSTQAIRADTFHGLWVKCSKKPTKENLTKERNPPEAWLEREAHGDLFCWVSLLS